MIVTGFYDFAADVHVSIHLLSIRILLPDDNFSKHQWIFTKLGMYIDIVEIWFWISNGQISLIFDDTSIFCFLMII